MVGEYTLSSRGFLLWQHLPPAVPQAHARGALAAASGDSFGVDGLSTVPHGHLHDPPHGIRRAPNFCIWVLHLLWDADDIGELAAQRHSGWDRTIPDRHMDHNGLL